MSFNPETLPYYDPQQDRRVAVVTGGNSGIGYRTALHLYLHGFAVYLASRDPHRVDRALAHLRKDALRACEKYTALQRQNRHLGEVHALSLNLLDLHTIEPCVAQLRATEKSVSVLVLNAGIMAVPYEKSRDGFEVQMQTSYIGHFLLADKLLPLMDQPGVKDPRIVFLSSIGHWFAPFRFSLASQFDYWPNLLWTLVRYGMAKCAGIQFMKSMAKRHPNILCVSVHPGIILNTNLFAHLYSWPVLGSLFLIAFQIVQYFVGVSVEEGCLSTLKAAASDELDLDRDNGKYYTTFGVEATPSFVARDEAHAEQNWAWTVAQLEERGYPIGNL